MVYPQRQSPFTNVIRTIIQCLKNNMKIIKNNFIPFPGFAAINLFGVLFVRKGTRISLLLLNHESIHTAQMKELWYVGFYLLYLLEWLYRLPGGRAYYNISFEKEAYLHQGDPGYLGKRKKFAWKNYLK